MYYEPQGGWELENGDEQPVIVILDPQKVRAKLQEGRVTRFEPNAERLRQVMRIPENGFLELPDIRDGAYGGLVFRQGRHRTVALASLGFSASPSVTTACHAPSLLAKFGASIDAASRHFDWSSIDDYPVMGV